MRFPKRNTRNLTLLPLWLIIFLLLTQVSAQSQSEIPPPQVEEVVLDTLSFKNGDTTIKELQEADADEEEYESSSDTTLTEPIIFRSVPDSITKRLKGEKDFEYANDPRYWVKKKKKETSTEDDFNWNSLGAGIKFFMYLLLAAALIFVVYRLIVTNNLFYAKSRKIAQTGKVDDLEVSDENIDDKINTAINTGNFRMATRFLYIKTLKKLDGRGWIRYHPQATNYEYLNQISQHTIAEDFGFVTRVYEYVWYGEFNLNEQQFQATKLVFEKIFKETR